MPLNRVKKLKLLLVSVIVITISVTVVVFINYRQAMNARNNSISTSPGDDANISIGKVHQTATRNGVKEWSLDARSAHYVEAERQAVFDDLSVLFFLKDNKRVYLKADRGILKTDSNDIEVTGNVEMKSDIYRLNAESLHYEHDQRIIFSKVPVKIIGNSFDLVADAMSLNLSTNRTLFEGNVEGIFSEHIRL
ncbi:LPS export ABC transporter periplasmic protein LptC [Thermodesulfobacteriota bacterium]